MGTTIRVAPDWVHQAAASPLLNPMNAALWLLTRWRQRQIECGTLPTAMAMRKQGIPLEVALAVLVPGSARRCLP